MDRRLKAAVILWASSLPWALSAARAQNERSALASDYLDESRNNPSLYNSAPITHIIPAFNTITYALALDYKNVTVTSPKPSYGPDTNPATLKLSGYGVTPYLAISLRYIGLGFSAESGSRTALFTQTNNGQSSADVQGQKSTLSYSAIGAYLYLIPFPTLDYGTLTGILGGKTYNVKHVVGGSYDSTTGQVFAQDNEYRYAVGEYEAGLNLGIRLLKNFMLIPWVDYSYIDTREIEGIASPATGPKLQTLGDDVQMFWHADPKFRYGLDFSVRIKRFEVHLGSVFGTIASPQKSDTVNDRSFSLNLSFDQKGG